MFYSPGSASCTLPLNPHSEDLKRPRKLFVNALSPLRIIPEINKSIGSASIIGSIIGRIVEKSNGFFFLRSDLRKKKLPELVLVETWYKGLD